MYKTVSIWGRDLLPNEDIMVSEATAVLYKQGKTDGMYVKNADSEVTRTWDTQETAQAWADFLNTMVPPPVSVKVLPV